MDYTSIFALMRAEVTLTAILVLLFLYDLMAGHHVDLHLEALLGKIPFEQGQEILDSGFC